MRTATAVAHFRTQSAVADAAGVTPQAVSQWGPVVPYVSARKLAAASEGLLAIDVSLYDDRLRPISSDAAA